MGQVIAFQAIAGNIMPINDNSESKKKKESKLKPTLPTLGNNDKYLLFVVKDDNSISFYNNMSTGEEVLKIYEQVLDEVMGE